MDTATVSALSRPPIVAVLNWEYVESCSLVVDDWDLAINVRFFESQLDGHNAVAVKAGEPSVADVVKA